jgi:Fe(3+) dicitrate transport protein
MRYSFSRTGVQVSQSSLFASLLLGASFASSAQTPLSLEPVTLLAAVPETGMMKPTVVYGEAEFAESVQPPFLLPVEGTMINSGKKTSVLDFDAFPRLNNNYRQALAKTPGLLLSEETSPLLSLGYRGLNPHRAQFTQVLKDGIPIHADPIGYPEAYYVPPLDTVDRLEFVRGGASLMYGPQPGGALNYVTHRPRTDKEFSFRTQQLFGSDDLYTTLSSVDGTIGRLGYYAYYNHRQGDGFRQANSDFQVDAGSFRTVLDADKDSRWVFTFDGYAENHGEPGGLTFETGPNTVNYDVDRTASSRFFDRFALERYHGSLVYERDFSEDTALTATAWGGYYSRFSKRQRGGGFGTLPIGAAADSNSIELQEFWSQGLETRLRHNWTRGDDEQTLSAGVHLFHNDSPRVDKRGTAPDADDGALRSQSQREVFYGSVFMENRFVFDKLSITPGLRLENIYQTVEEIANVDKTAAGTPLGDEAEYDFVPLLGLGLEYELKPLIWAYGNVSQAYRPKIFTEAVPTGPNSFVNGDLEEGASIQYELGLKGTPTAFITWDASAFLMDFDNQIGSVAVPGGTSMENVGRAIHQGIEAAVDIELIGLAAALRGEMEHASDHELSLYANATLLHAEFVSGPREGNTPQYAPDYIVRSGLIYRWRDRAKVALLGTFVDDHYADDANTDRFRVPGYMVWDLTGEVKVYKDHLSLIGGINNLLNEDYYSRIRGDGIDPSYGRNYYAGLALSF